MEQNFLVEGAKNPKCLRKIVNKYQKVPLGIDFKNAKLLWNQSYSTEITTL